MPRKVFVRNRVQPDHIEADALIASVQNVPQDLFIDARILAKIRVFPPPRIPAEIKQQKVDRIFQPAVFP